MMKITSRVLLALLCCFATFSVFAQKTVSGAVSGPSGPLPGVTVSVKGTSRATQTDGKGNFSIEAKDNETLVVSIVGFTTQSVKVGSQSSIVVSLVERADELEGVTVTAFGIKREKRSLGYAAQEVGGKQLTIAQAPTIAQGLMGKVAGLQISQAGGGQDGGSSRLVVRGNTSITGDNRALIVVDGVPINNDPLNVNNNNGGNGKSVLGGLGADVSGYNDWGTGLNNLSPDDIESITVLKGPTAAALYGSRAGNGVIMVTRKKGNNRPGLGVDYSFSTRWTKAYEMLDYQNEYGQGGVASMTSADQTKWFPLNGNSQRMQIGNNTNSAGNYVNNSHGPLPYPLAYDFYTYFSYPGSYSWGPRFDNLPIMNYDGVQRPYSAKPDNWRAFFPDGTVSTHNVALSGGNELATIRLSYMRNETKPNMINSNMKSNTFNVGSSVKISKRLSAELNASYTNFNRLNAPQIGSGWQTAPTYSMARDFDPALVFSQQFGPNGEQVNFGAYPSVANAPAFPWNTGYLNNQYWALLKNNSELTRNQLIGSLKLMADITDWLNITAQGGIDNSNDIFTVKNMPVDVLGQLNGQFRESSSKFATRNLNAFVRLHKDNFFIKGFNAALTMGGESYFRNDYSVSNNTAGNFVRPFLFTLNNGANAVPAAVETKYTKKINSVFSFLNLSYKDYLFLEATARNDWFSTLLPENNRILYPSVNLGYVFTDHVKGLQSSLPWLNFGKLKLSYAVSGNDNSVDPGFVYNTLESAVYNGQQAQSLLASLKTANVKPVINRAYEVGLNLGMFNRRLNLDVTYFSMESENQILNNPLPISSGFNNIVINTGALGNKGIELILSGSPIRKKDFSWDVSINAAHSTTRLLSLTNGVDELNLGSYFGGAGVSMRVKVGEKYGTLYGKDYTYLDGQRVVRRALGTDKNPVTFTANGQTYYAGTEWVLTPTEVAIGNALPWMTGGITNTFRYKNFSLYILADAKLGGDTYFGTYEAAMGSGTINETLKERNGGGLPYTYPDGTTGNVGVNFGGVFADKTPNNDVVHYLWYYAGTYSAWNHIGRPTSSGVFENSWMKLRELSLSYQLPRHLVSKTKILQNLSFSVIGRDLFYIFTTIPKGLNPEGVNGIGNIQGIEYASMPKVRSFGFSVKASF